MSRSITFVSTCPACGHQRLQDAYTRRGITRLLETGHTVDAYCVTCDVLWPLSAQERVVLGNAIAAERHEAPPVAPADPPDPRYQSLAE